MKILMTGGNGYIGQELTKILRNNGYSVVSFDKTHLNRDSFEFKGDLIRETDISECFKENAGIKNVIHLAAIAGVERDASEYKAYLDNNVVGTSNLLKAMNENKAEKILLASSCSVYGSGRSHKEESELRPESFYGLSKVLSEEVVKYYGSAFGISYNILRIFNVIGHGFNSDSQSKRLVPKILHNIRNGTEINSYLQKNSHEAQVRDYVDIKNVVKVFHDLISNPRPNEVFNIGSGKGTSVIEIAEICAKLIKKEYKIKPANPRLGDCDTSVANTEKLKKFDLLEKTSIENIIQEILKQ